ncbi:hypothetical protein [Halovulum sp. GXIMD14793]
MASPRLETAGQTWLGVKDSLGRSGALIVGQRCNLIIVKNGRCDIYYDHWAANRLDQELFWGPEIARAFIEQRDAQPDSLLDDRWSEGGCVLDFDTKHLLWYGGEDTLRDAAANLAHQDLMSSQWPGWQVEWAKDGIFDIAAKLNLPRRAVSSDLAFEPNRLSLPHTESYQDAIILYASGVLSYQLDGQLCAAAFCGDDFGDGYSCLDEDLTKQSLVDFVNSFSLKEFQEARAIDKNWLGFETGIHFDFDAMTVDLWYPSPSEGFPDLFRRRWHSFTHQFHGPDYRWHKDMFPMLGWPDVNADVKRQRLKDIRNTLDRDEGTNPAISTMKAMKESFPDASIEVSESILHHRPQDLNLKSQKYDILDRLRSGL